MNGFHPSVKLANLLDMMIIIFALLRISLQNWDVASDSILHSSTWKFLIASKGKAVQYMQKNQLTDRWDNNNNNNN